MRVMFLSFMLLVSSQVLGQQPKEITNSIGMTLVSIPAGKFSMGSPEGEIGRQTNESQHEVTISKPYYLGKFEVSQTEYELVMGMNPSDFKGPKHPVEMVSWDDAVAFCKKLSDMPDEKSAGRQYRLPTEAEWEYACRATSTSSYGFGDAPEKLSEYAWFGVGPQGKTHPVGEKKANLWGLHDMHGNVYEWCQDLLVDYPSTSATDQRVPGEGKFRVFRGGCWNNRAINCRTAFRTGFSAEYSSRKNGFRVALSQ